MKKSSNYFTVHSATSISLSINPSIELRTGSAGGVIFLDFQLEKGTIILTSNAIPIQEVV